MDKSKLRNKIKAMIQEVEKRVESEENERRNSFWDRKGIPVKDQKKIPIRMIPELQMWARLHEISLVDLYKVPELFIYTQLKIKLFAFDNFMDDQPIDREIRMWYGSPFEGALFGLPFIFLEAYEPEDNGVFLHEDCREVLKRIKQPDFYSSGIMPLVHRMYVECQKLIPDTYELVFPDFIQAPLQIGFHLLGMENFLVAFIQDPKGATSLLNRLINIRVEFRKQRAKFLDIDFGPGIYDNDAVGEPIISPKIYRDFVWPIESKMAALEGGIEYWHSCGNTTRMMEWIRKLPNCKSWHVSPWSDRKKAAETYDCTEVLQLCMHPVRDVMNTSDSYIEENIKDIITTLDGHRYFIDADGIQASMNMPEQIKKMQNWIRIAHNVIDKHSAA
jgi:hypothetical protein